MRRIIRKEWKVSILLHLYKKDQSLHLKYEKYKGVEEKEQINGKRRRKVILWKIKSWGKKQSCSWDHYSKVIELQSRYHGNSRVLEEYDWIY